jgi:hypothetical protein
MVATTVYPRSSPKSRVIEKLLDEPNDAVREQIAEHTLCDRWFISSL